MDMDGIDPEVFTKSVSTQVALITTPYECRDISLKLRKSRRRHTQPASSYTSHKKVLQERRLYQAASFNDVERLKQILKEDIDPNSSDEQGRTVLHIAASRGYAEAVQVLLKAGANANAEDKLGNTPMHLAVYTGSIETVSNLLEGGCRLRKTAMLPYTPLELAQSKYLMLSKQECCVLPRSQAFRIITLLRRAIETDLFNKLTAEARKQEVDELLKGLAKIEIDGSEKSKK